MIYGEPTEYCPMTIRVKEKMAFFPVRLRDGRKVWLQKYYDVYFWHPTWMHLSPFEVNCRSLTMEPCEGYWDMYQRCVAPPGHTDQLQDSLQDLYLQYANCVEAMTTLAPR